MRQRHLIEIVHNAQCYIATNARDSKNAEEKCRQQMTKSFLLSYN